MLPAAGIIALFEADVVEVAAVFDGLQLRVQGALGGLLHGLVDGGVDADAGGFDDFCSALRILEDGDGLLLNEGVQEGGVAPQGLGVQLQRLFFDSLCVLGREVAGALHAIQHVVAPAEVEVGVVHRVVVLRVLDEGRYAGRLAHGQISRLFAEVAQRRRSDAVVTATEVDTVEVKLHDLALVVGLLDAHGEKDLDDLALVFVAAHGLHATLEVIGVAGELLRDG